MSSAQAKLNVRRQTLRSRVCITTLRSGLKMTCSPSSMVDMQWRTTGFELHRWTNKAQVLPSLDQLEGEDSSRWEWPLLGDSPLATKPRPPKPKALTHRATASNSELRDRPLMARLGRSSLSSRPLPKGRTQG